MSLICHRHKWLPWTFLMWWSVSVVELLYVAEKSTHWLFLKYFTELVGHFFFLFFKKLTFTKECGDFKKLQINLIYAGMFWLSHSLCYPHKGWKRELQVEAEVLVFLFFCLKQVDQNLTGDSYNCLRLLEPLPFTRPTFSSLLCEITAEPPS